jgi:hypothetical protein
MILSSDSPFKSRMSATAWMVVALLIVHASMLAWIGLRNSPSPDEVGHLASGLSHWKLGRFDLYRVNPPLVRSVAAVPLLFFDVQADWTAFNEAPLARSEFSVGSRFCELNGAKGFFYFTLARWICIPLSVLGGFVVYRWALELYGSPAGLLALVLFSFSPNVLGNSAMITPDAPAASLGVTALYLYWRWLKHAGWPRAITSGLAFGIAELTKTTWIVLFGLLPLLWFAWRITDRHRLSRGESEDSSAPDRGTPSLWQLATILLLALYVINLGYGFEDSLTPLKKFLFVSRALGGAEAHQEPGNRIADSWFGEIPIPVPANYLKGIDVQRYDFEKGKVSYMLGVQEDRGWWYWYLFALAVKVPLGTWLLSLVALLAAVRYRLVRADWRDTLVLITPALVVFVLVSSQTGFSRYLRYVLPIAPFCHIWIAQAGRAIALRRRAASTIIVFSVVLSVTSSLAAFPHSLSYFNELAGGPLHGPDYLLDANIDWGQDLLNLKRWYDAHPEARPLYIQYFGFPPNAPQNAGIQFREMPRIQSNDPSSDVGNAPNVPHGWYAISVNKLYGYKHAGSEEPWYSYLLQENPIAMAGYSIRIYRLSVRDAERINLRVSGGRLPR